MANSFMGVDKSQRMSVTNDMSFVSERAYNLAIGGLVLYGLAANAITCRLFPKEMLTGKTYLVVIIAYIICAIIGSIMVNRSAQPIIRFLGYNLVVVPMGFMLAIVVAYYQPQVVVLALGVTASVTVIMICLAALFPSFFLGLGRVLFASLLLSLLANVIFAFFLPQSLGFMDYVIATIFSLYIAFDWARANKYPKTVNNAIASAFDIYYDIVNLFLRVLSIMGRKN